MLGMMNKGGGNQMMPQGQNSNLAALFGNNMATQQPGMQQQQLPQIMAPQRPQIMPPAQTSPMQQFAQPKKMDPNQMLWIGGQNKPAWMTSLVQQTGMPTTRPTDKAFYKYRQR